MSRWLAQHVGGGYLLDTHLDRLEYMAMSSTISLTKRADVPCGWWALAFKIRYRCTTCGCVVAC